MHGLRHRAVTTSRRRRCLRDLLPAVAVATVVALAAGGCGSPSPKRPSRTLTVAVEVPGTGPDHAVGAAIVQGAEDAASRIDSSGGVLGRSLVIRPEDDGGTVAAAGRIARRLVADPPTAVIGPIYPVIADEVLPLYRQAGVPVVSMAGGGAEQQVPGIGWTDDQQAALVAQELVEVLHAGHVTVFVDTADRTAGLQSALQGLLGAAGVQSTVVAVQASAQFDTAAGTVVSGHPDAVVVLAGDNDAGAMANALHRSRLVAPCVAATMSPGAASYLAAAGSAASTCVVGGPVTLPLLPNANGPGSTGAAPGGATALWNALGHDALDVVAAGLEQAGSSAPDALRQALADTAGVPGTTGTVTVDPITGDRRVPPLAILDAHGSTLSIDGSWAAYSGWPPASTSS